QPPNPPTWGATVASFSSNRTSYVFSADPIPADFPLSRSLPVCVFAAPDRGECNGAGARGHQQRATHDLRRVTAGCAMQFAEDKNSPQESPELVGVGQGNAAADPQVFCGILLEQITDHPHKPTQHQPEQYIAGLR